MRQTLRAKWLVTAAAIEVEVLVTMEAMATWTAQLVAATPTRYESKQHSWLEKVSARATVKECGVEVAHAPSAIRQRSAHKYAVPSNHV